MAICRATDFFELARARLVGRRMNPERRGVRLARDGPRVVYRPQLPTLPWVENQTNLFPGVLEVKAGGAIRGAGESLTKGRVQSPELTAK